MIDRALTYFNKKIGLISPAIVDTDDQQFTVENVDQLYVLVSFARKTTHCDMTCTVLKVAWVV